MLSPNDYSAMMDYKLNRLPAIVAGAEQQRMLEEAGLIRRPWLSCQICRSLWRLGRLLVAAGGRLEERYRPIALSPAPLAANGLSARRA